MALFNFGDRQRMHTQIYGHTSGSEMFVIQEYENAKKNFGGCIGIGLFLAFLTFGFFSIGAYSVGIFMAIGVIACVFFGMHYWDRKSYLYQKVVSRY